MKAISGSWLDGEPGCEFASTQEGSESPDFRRVWHLRVLPEIAFVPLFLFVPNRSVLAEGYAF